MTGPVYLFISVVCLMLVTALATAIAIPFIVRALDFYWSWAEQKAKEIFRSA